MKEIPLDGALTRSNILKWSILGGPNRNPPNSTILDN